MLYLWYRAGEHRLSVSHILIVVQLWSMALGLYRDSIHYVRSCVVVFLAVNFPNLTRARSLDFWVSTSTTWEVSFSDPNTRSVFRSRTPEGRGGCVSTLHPRLTAICEPPSNSRRRGCWCLIEMCYQRTAPLGDTCTAAYNSYCSRFHL